MSASRSGERGFTLVEALVAALIFAFIVVTTLQFFATNGSLYKSGQSRAEAQQNARVALEAAAREIRMAGYDPAGTIASQATPTRIQSATASSLTFLADVTNDNVLDKITYSLSGTTFTRDFCSWSGTTFPTATSGEIAEGVAALAFTYYDSTNTAITAPVASGSLSTINRVTISITASRTTVQQQQTFPLVVDIDLRN